LRRDHERPGNITAIVLVLDSKTGEDDARLQVVLVRFGADLEIVFASRLDDRRVNPICGSEVNVGELLVLVPDLHVCWFVVASELFLTKPIERTDFSITTCRGVRIEQLTLRSIRETPLCPCR
jgi:hypothetical protein